MTHPMMKKNDKVMLIGSKGNLGGQIMRVFGNEYRLVLFDKNNIDIIKQDEVEKAVDFHKPNFIINTAAYNAVDLCEEEEEFARAKKINQEAVGFLADAAIKHDSVLINFSSDYVFGSFNKEELTGIAEQGGFSENIEPRPNNNYARTKHGGEQEIMKRASKGLRFYLVRTSKLFGSKGESKSAKPSFFDTMLQLSKKKKKMQIVDGERSCFTYTFDLAKSIKNLIENKNEFGIYHIVNQESATWYEGLKYLFEICDVDVELEKVSSADFKRPAERPDYTVLKNTKLEPLRSYKDALKEYLNI